jgi:hypothetical protein
MLQTKHRFSDGTRFRSSEANYSYASAAGRSGDGDDGVIEIQGDSSFGEI